MPITQTQDDFRIRSIDSVHINPSIMEGSNLYPSILGPGRGVPLERHAPTNLVAPSISGSLKIPSTLTCNPGVWDGAPTAKYTYQWRADGVDLLGETDPTLLTYFDLDAQDIDCIVVATNNTGSVTITSSAAITVSIVEPISVTEQDYFVLTGLGQETRQNINIALTFIISGMAADERQDIYSHGVYLVNIPEVTSILALQNSNAEDGVNDWIVSAGTLGLRYASPTPQEGLAYFFGGSDNVSHIYQDVSVLVGDEVDVDASQQLIEATWHQASLTGLDEVHVYVEFLDGSDATISTDVMLGSLVGSVAWEYKMSELVEVPPLTRKYRVHVEFTKNAGTDHNGYVDNINVNLWKN